MGNDEAFRVVPGSFPQDGETMGQIGEDLFRLVFHGSIKNNALWDGTFSRPLNVLVVPKNKKTTLYSAYLLSWQQKQFGINIDFKLPIGKNV